MTTFSLTGKVLAVEPVQTKRGTMHRLTVQCDEDGKAAPLEVAYFRSIPAALDIGAIIVVTGTLRSREYQSRLYLGAVADAIGVMAVPERRETAGPDDVPEPPQQRDEIPF